MSLIANVDELQARLKEVIAAVRSGNTVVLVDQSLPVAKIVPMHEPKGSGVPLRYGIFPAIEVLTPVVHRSDIAEEMFGE